jgi:hypothetical protein
LLGATGSVFTAECLEAAPRPVRRTFYLMILTVAVDVSCFCTPSCRKFAETIALAIDRSGPVITA